jgi:hypothetical protein
MTHGIAETIQTNISTSPKKKLIIQKKIKNKKPKTKNTNSISIFLTTHFRREWVVKKMEMRNRE